MASAAWNVKVVKVPAWMTHGIDLDSKINDALESVGSEIQQRQGKGLGARRNTITRQRSMVEQRIFTTSNRPRRTGAAMTRLQTGRFKSMAPRAVNKYIVKPLEAEWGR